MNYWLQWWLSGPSFAQLFYIELLSIHSGTPNFMFHQMRVKVTDTQCSDHILFPHHPRATLSFSRRDPPGWPQAESLEQPEGNESTLQTQVNKKWDRALPSSLAYTDSPLGCCCILLWQGGEGNVQPRAPQGGVGAVQHFTLNDTAGCCSSFSGTQNRLFLTKAMPLRAHRLCFSEHSMTSNYITGKKLAWHP